MEAVLGEDVQEYAEVRLQGEPVQLPHPVEVDARGPLVGEARVEVSVRDDYLAPPQGRLYDLLHVLVPVGRVEEGLGLGRQPFSPRPGVPLEEGADAVPARLRRLDHVEAPLPQLVREELHVGVLAAAVDALDDDEEPAASHPREM